MFAEPQNSTFITVNTPRLQRGPVPDSYSVPTNAEEEDVDSEGLPADLDIF